MVAEGSAIVKFGRWDAPIVHLCRIVY